jgi:hypothetical protein
MKRYNKEQYILDTNVFENINEREVFEFNENVVKLICYGAQLELETNQLDGNGVSMGYGIKSNKVIKKNEIVTIGRGVFMLKDSGISQINHAISIEITNGMDAIINNELKKNICFEKIKGFYNKNNIFFPIGSKDNIMFYFARSTPIVLVNDLDYNNSIEEYTYRKSTKSNSVFYPSFKYDSVNNSYELLGVDLVASEKIIIGEKISVKYGWMYWSLKFRDRCFNTLDSTEKKKYLEDFKVDENGIFIESSKKELRDFVEKSITKPMKCREYKSSKLKKISQKHLFDFNITNNLFVIFCKACYDKKKGDQQKNIKRKKIRLENKKT